MQRLCLYGSGTSRWIRPLWMLKELNVTFDIVELNRSNGDLRTESFLRLNPEGKIPVLTVDGIPICESVAITTFLADKFIEKNLIPIAGTTERGIHDQWMCAILNQLEAPIWIIHRHETKNEGGPGSTELAEKHWKQGAQSFEAHLKNKEFLIGHHFQAADILLSHLLTWGVVRKRLEMYPSLLSYVKRTTARPGFPKEYYSDLKF